jgi:hypothetical protein
MIHTTTSPASPVDFAALVRRRRREALDALDRPGAALVVTGTEERPLYAIAVLGSFDGEYRSRPLAPAMARDLLGSGLLIAAQWEAHGAPAYILPPGSRVSAVNREPARHVRDVGGYARVAPLKEEERAALAALIEARSFRSVSADSGFDYNTLRKAVDGGGLYPNTARAVRAYLREQAAPALRRAA